MIDIDVWMNDFQQSLNKNFADRVWFVGLQGSYSRGEATETSDIDVVVILDELTVSDIRAYNAMIDKLPYRELICGFLSGKKELLHWEASDLFQFNHDTKPIKGTLEELMPLIDKAAIDRAIHFGACNIYHGCVHNMLHEKSEEILRSLYKSASFVVQASAFQRTGNYIRRQNDLLDYVSKEEAKIVRTLIGLKQGEPIQFSEMSETLFEWAKELIGNNMPVILRTRKEI